MVTEQFMTLKQFLLFWKYDDYNTSAPFSYALVVPAYAQGNCLLYSSQACFHSFGSIKELFRGVLTVEKQLKQRAERPDEKHGSSPASVCKLTGVGVTFCKKGLQIVSVSKLLFKASSKHVSTKTTARNFPLQSHNWCQSTHAPLGAVGRSVSGIFYFSNSSEWRIRRQEAQAHSWGDNGCEKRKKSSFKCTRLLLFHACQPFHHRPAPGSRGERKRRESKLFSIKKKQITALDLSVHCTKTADILTNPSSTTQGGEANLRPKPSKKRLKSSRLKQLCAARC